MKPKKSWIFIFLILLLILYFIPSFLALSIPSSIPLKYLEANVMKPNFEGKVFCTTKHTQVKKIGKDIDYYTWALCEEITPDMEVKSGASLPVHLTIQKKNGTYEVIDMEIPRDGHGYSEDLWRIFPFTFPSHVSGDQLKPEVKKQAEAYYKK